MAALNPQATELNRIIRIKTPSCTSYYLKKARRFIFPPKASWRRARPPGKEINATIGTAYEDDGNPMVLPALSGLLKIDSKDAFPYAPSEGLKTLREKWQELMVAKNPSLGKGKISLPVVTCGVTNALSVIAYMFLDGKDDVILADLYWENYDLVFTNAYGRA